MSQENVESFKRGTELLNRRDIESFLEMLDPEVEWHPGLVALLEGEATVYRGREEVRQMLQDIFEARKPRGPIHQLNRSRRLEAICHNDAQHCEDHAERELIEISGEDIKPGLDQGHVDEGRRWRSLARGQARPGQSDNEERAQRHQLGAKELSR